jgi:hypothetical protein
MNSMTSQPINLSIFQTIFLQCNENPLDNNVSKLSSIFQFSKKFYNYLLNFMEYEAFHVKIALCVQLIYSRIYLNIGFICLI